MRAQRRRAMRIGTFETEPHAGAKIGGAPMFPIGLAGKERRGEAPIRVTPARPDMPLVQVGVHIREGRKDDPSVEIEKRRCWFDRRPSRLDRSDPPVLDEKGSRRPTV